MKYLSLFTGIGGFELGIQQAHVEKSNRTKNGRGSGNPQTDDAEGSGLVAPKGKGARSKSRRFSEHIDHGSGRSQPPSCVGYSEIDKHAIGIYEKHFKHQNYGDITKLDASLLPDFDFLCGGFPCQAFSIAGKRRGFEDTRGTLFFDICRILKAKRPRLLLLENVRGLLSHDEGRTFSTIISTLDDLGYDLQWQVLNSKDFGVPQNRERIFIVGHLRGTPRPQVFPFGESIGLSHPSGRPREASSGIAGAVTSNLKRGVHSGGETYAVGTLRTHKDGQGFRQSQSGLVPTIPARAGEDGSGQPILMRETKDGFHQYRDDKKKSSIQGTHVTYPKGKSHALSTAHIPMTISRTVRSGGRNSPHGAKQNWDSYEVGGMIRRLTPMECERLQGFPDRWTEGVSDTQRYKTLGNAVTVNVIQAIMERIL